ncbi:MAG: YjbQ family protein [Parcubacteria group bacterium]
MEIIERTEGKPEVNWFSGSITVHMSLKIKTIETFDYSDFTPIVKKFLSKFYIKTGQVIIWTRNTTFGLVPNEHEHGFLKDLIAKFKEWFPLLGTYEHNNFHNRPGVPKEERANGYGHLMASMLPKSITVPIIIGEMCLGKWMSIMGIELDGAREDRAVDVLLSGSFNIRRYLMACIMTRLRGL